MGWFDMVWHGKAGKVGSGMARLGRGRQGTADKARRGVVRHGETRQTWHGELGHGGARKGR